MLIPAAVTWQASRTFESLMLLKEKSNAPENRVWGEAWLVALSSPACPDLLQPAGSTGSSVTTPPPLVRGTQNIPSGKPSLQVSVYSASCS